MAVEASRRATDELAFMDNPLSLKRTIKIATCGQCVAPCNQISSVSDFIRLLLQLGNRIASRRAARRFGRSTKSVSGKFRHAGDLRAQADWGLHGARSGPRRSVSPATSATRHLWYISSRYAPEYSLVLRGKYPVIAMNREVAFRQYSCGNQG